MSNLPINTSLFDSLMPFITEIFTDSKRVTYRLPVGLLINEDLISQYFDGDVSLTVYGGSISGLSGVIKNVDLFCYISKNCMAGRICFNFEVGNKT